MKENGGGEEEKRESLKELEKLHEEMKKGVF